MNYPSHLLPFPNYKKIKWSEDLRSLFLIRHTATKDLLLPNTEIIDPDRIKIQSDHLRDFSTNLFGIFKVEDVYIKVTNPSFFEEWKENTSVDPPLFSNDFYVDSKRGYFFLPINKLLDTNMVVERNKTVMNLNFKILHTPTKCNFWHFSIRVFYNNTEVNSLAINDKQKKILWRNAKVKLSNLIVSSMSSVSRLDKKHYLK